MSASRYSIEVQFVFLNMSKTKAEQPQESANMVEPPKNRRIAGIT